MPTPVSLSFAGADVLVQALTCSLLTHPVRPMMDRMPRSLSSLLVLTVVACAPSSSPGVASPSKPSTPSFSDAQSDRGRSVFRALCTECHASSDFSDARFKRRWSRRTAGSLYDLIRNTMPESAPGSLRADHVVDVVSYILRMNGFAAGTDELDPDPAILDAISLARIGGS